MKKRVNIVGVGMNRASNMTENALEAVEKADVIIGAKRMTSFFPKLKKPVFISYDPLEIKSFLSDHEYTNAAVLFSGDCGFYSGAQRLLAVLKDDFDCEVYCGISSPVYFCSKLKLPWSDIKFVSLHGKTANIARIVSSNKRTFFLMGGSVTVSDVCERLCEYGLSDVKIYIGEELGGRDEKITFGYPREFLNTKTSSLCVLMTENINYEKTIRSSIPDNEFLRGRVPMTKSEVRGLSVSKLQIGKDDICWDIGSGTGSVSVEMALKCENGKVYSVEKNIEAVKLTDENRHRFRCDNIEIINETAQSAAQNLPAPDCVFIGGSSGGLEIITDIVYNKNPKAKIVVTAVSIETLSQCVSIFGKYNVDPEIIQLSVTRTKKASNHTMLNAENPIFIIRSEKNE